MPWQQLSTRQQMSTGEHFRSFTVNVGIAALTLGALQLTTEGTAPGGLLATRS